MILQLLPRRAGLPSYLLLSGIVASSLMDVQDIVNFFVSVSSGKDGSTHAEVLDPSAANVAEEDWAGSTALLNNFDHVDLSM